MTSVQLWEKTWKVFIAPVIPEKDRKVSFIRTLSWIFLPMPNPILYFMNILLKTYLERSCLSCDFAATRQILFYSLRCWLKAALLTSQLIPAAVQSSAAGRYGS